MTEQELEKLIQDKFAEETKKFERPHKFFITENGRGVCDGGDLYNQVFEDVLGVQIGEIAGNQVGNLFEYAFLAASRHVHQGTCGSQNGFESDHEGGGVSEPWRLAGDPAAFPCA